MTQQQLERVVDKIVAEKVGPAVEQIIIQQTSYSGPLPPSTETEKFERICPGFTDRWIKMSEQEQVKRYQVIDRRDKFEMIYRMSALVASSVITLCMVVGGIALLYHGKTLGGFASIGMAAAAIIGALLYRHSKSQEKAPEAKGGRTT